MNIDTKTSLVGFLLALSTLTVANQAQANSQIGAIANSNTNTSIEGRLQRLTNLMKDTADNLATDNNLPQPVSKLAAWGNGRGRGWANGGGGGNWRNGGGGGSWSNGGGGGAWVNGNNWRNGWGDGGGFLNRR
ncbi:MAG: GrrA/OscA1 family cyclophane-containing rSAM-modified RiPP [Microcoleaceae cyanobacterium]